MYWLRDNSPSFRVKETGSGRLSGDLWCINILQRSLVDNNETANLWKPVWELRSGSPTLFLSLVLKFLQACHLRQLITFQEVFVPLRQVATQIQFLRGKLWSFRVIYYLCGNLGQIPAGKTCFNVTQWGLAKWAHSCFSVFVPQEEQQHKNYTSDISYI